MLHKDQETLNLLNRFAYDKGEQKTKEKIIYRDFGKIHIKKTEKENFWRYFLPIIGLIILIGIFNTRDNKANFENQILGKWRNNSAIGVIEIEFRKNTMLAFGLVENVYYEIEKNQIIVFDKDARIGTIYKIYDKDTIYTDALGIKAIYKRVKE